MAGTFKRLFQGNPTTETQLYVSPADTKTIVRQVVACNTDANDHTVTLGLIPLGQSADGTHRLLSEKSVPANDTLVFDIFQVMEAGDFLSGLVSDTTVTMTISGIQGIA